MQQTTPWVLIVEDDDNAREGLLVLLTDAGFRARGARNGQEALDLLDSGAPPSLMLVDLALPGVTGWDFMKYVHDDPELRFVPAIVMTASTEHGDIVADEVFGKPLDLRRLLRSITRIVAS